MADFQITDSYVKSLISRLNKYCFFDGSDKFRKATGMAVADLALILSWEKSKKNQYSRYVNASFKTAQKIIIKNRKAVEDFVESGKSSSSDKYDAQYVLRLLADYANTLAWAMLNQDVSEVRNQIHKIKSQSPLKHQNWESIELSLKQLNSDPDVFALSTDLTSFMDIGDIYFVNTKNGQRFQIEVKTGKTNDKVVDLITSRDKSLIDEKITNVLVGSTNPKKTLKQIQRVIRQFERGALSTELSKAKGKHRFEIDTKTKVNIFEDKRSESKWSDYLLEVVNDTKHSKVGRGWYDYCLYFSYGKKPLTAQEDFVFKYFVNDHYELGLTPEECFDIPVFHIEKMLALPMTPPNSTKFMKTLGPERQKKLMAQDEYLMVYIHIPGVKHLMNELGYELKIRNAKSNEQKYEDGIMTKLFGQNKIPVLKSLNNDFEWSILTGTWQRILFDFMAPQELAKYSDFLARERITKDE